MQIVRTYGVMEVRFTRISNAPFKVMLDPLDHRRAAGESFLVLDREASARIGVPPRVSLLKQKLRFTLEATELPLKPNGFIDKWAGSREDLQILSLEERESVSFGHEVKPAMTFWRVERLLVVGTRSGGDFHFSITPCPLYNLVITLSEKEYEECKMLPPNSVFRMKVRVF